MSFAAMFSLANVSTLRYGVREMERDMNKLMDRRVWIYAVIFAASYATMKFLVPWHVILS